MPERKERWGHNVWEFEDSRWIMFLAEEVKNFYTDVPEENPLLAIHYITCDCPLCLALDKCQETQESPLECASCKMYAHYMSGWSVTNNNKLICQGCSES